jgi:hypothetical protein
VPEGPEIVSAFKGTATIAGMANDGREPSVRRLIRLASRDGFKRGFSKIL